MGFIIDPNRFTVVWATGTGGTITTVGGYKVHKFTSSGSFVVTKSGVVEYLVVAGGGSGSKDSGNDGYSTNPGAGGGGGGFRTNVTGSISGGNSSPEAPLSLTTGTYSVTVGAGGAGGTCFAASGGNSVFHTITSIGGGGGGGGCGYSGASGGSGGGSSYFYNTNTNNYEAFGSPGSGTTGQGFQGGLLTGGGAGGAAANESAGGAGLSSSIDGVSTLYAAGAGSGYGGAGTANRGNGGNGNPSNRNDGYAGGSGIVIIRYKL